MGIVGASRLGDPISRDLKDAAVLPGSDAAVGLTTTGEVYGGLRDGSTTNLGVEGVTNIAASPRVKSPCDKRRSSPFVFSVRRATR